MVAKKSSEKQVQSAGPKSATAEQQGLSADEIVDARTSDGSDDGRYHKTYVVLARDWNEDSDADDANKVAVLQEALNLGLHPRGDVAYDGAEAHPDGHSLFLRYSVEVIPAALDENPADTKTPSKKLDELGGSTETDK